MDVNVQVDVNVSQDGNFAQGIAEAKQKLAEVDRKLQIVDAQLAQDSGELSLLSPISGTVSTIEERNGKYFIHLFANEKSVITYVKESEWHDIEEGQSVKNYSTHREGVVEGSISSKTQVPANASKWLTAYEQFEHKIDEPFYEVQDSVSRTTRNLAFCGKSKLSNHYKPSRKCCASKIEMATKPLRQMQRKYTHSQVRAELLVHL